MHKRAASDGRRSERSGGLGPLRPGRRDRGRGLRRPGPRLPGEPPGLPGGVYSTGGTSRGGSSEVREDRQRREVAEEAGLVDCAGVPHHPPQEVWLRSGIWSIGEGGHFRGRAVGSGFDSVGARPVGREAVPVQIVRRGEPFRHSSLRALHCVWSCRRRARQAVVSLQRLFCHESGRVEGGVPGGIHPILREGPRRPEHTSE
mmetsp:Transcript_25599/g.66834  ORF Transcript_25599/g.66834 Transcript_25599/m.66834 type:complete len:202 (+) Transcript_25599:681-1286(+)